MKNCFLSILITVSCFSASAQNANRFVVLPYQPKTMFYIFPENYKDAKLSPTDLKIIDSLLSVCISEYNKTAVIRYNKLKKKYPQNVIYRNNFVIELKSYRRQYVAAATATAKGERRVWVNCFCNDDHEYWTKEIVHVLDGGNCYFNLKIDLSKKKYFDFMVNADA